LPLALALVNMRRGILVFLLENEKNRLGKEQNSIIKTKQQNRENLVQYIKKNGYTNPYLLILLSVQHFNLIISLQFAVLG